MSSGKRPIGAAKGKQTNTMASCQSPPRRIVPVLPPSPALSLAPLSTPQARLDFYQIAGGWVWGPDPVTPHPHSWDLRSFRATFSSPVTANSQVAPRMPACSTDACLSSQKVQG